MLEECCLMECETNTFGTVKVLTLYIATDAEQNEEMRKEIMACVARRQRSIIISTDEDIAALKAQNELLKLENESLRERFSIKDEDMSGDVDGVADDGTVIAIRAV